MCGSPISVFLFLFYYYVIAVFLIFYSFLLLSAFINVSFIAVPFIAIAFIIIVFTAVAFIAIPQVSSKDGRRSHQIKRMYSGRYHSFPFFPTPVLCGSNSNLFSGGPYMQSFPVPLSVKDFYSF